MKVAIYPNYGGMYIPPFITQQISGSKSWIHGRILMGDIIEKLEPTHDVINQSIYDDFESGKLNHLSYIKGAKKPNIIYVKNLNKNSFGYKLVYQIKVEDVDTSKVWKIGEYDGAEGIDYFNSSMIIDKDFNYGEW